MGTFNPESETFIPDEAEVESDVGDEISPAKKKPSLSSKK